MAKINYVMKRILDTLLHESDMNIMAITSFSIKVSLIATIFIGSVSCSISSEDISMEGVGEPRTPRREQGVEGSLKDLLIENPSNEDGALGSANVNLYLWQSYLETVGFMGLKAVSPETGVLITDWYRPKDANVEYQITVLHAAPYLRSNSVKVTAASRGLDETATKGSTELLSASLKNAILAGARDLRRLNAE